MPQLRTLQAQPASLDSMNNDGSAAASHPRARTVVLLAWIAERPDARLGMNVLADRLDMSECSVTRRFREETGMTPMEYIATVRLDRARALLEETDWPIDRIAAKSGFGSSDTLQRAFVRRLRATPRDYRKGLGAEHAEN